MTTILARALRAAAGRAVRFGRRRDLLAVMPTGAKGIEFEVDFNYGGTPDLQYFPSDGLTTRVGPVIAGKTYSVKVRGISWNAVIGGLSSATLFTPAAKTTAPTAPTNILTFSKPLGFSATWDAITDPDYFTTEITVSTSGTPSPSDAPIASSTGACFVFYPVTYSLTVWVRHVSRSQTKSAWVAASTGALAPDPINIVMMGILSVDSAQLVPDAVTAAKLSSTAVSTKMAAASVGDVGSYAFMKNSTAGVIAVGGTLAGSSLLFTDTSLSGAVASTGAWQAMGRCPAGQATVWLRIS